jgi:hypothetical protein
VKKQYAAKVYNPDNIEKIPHEDLQMSNNFIRTLPSALCACGDNSVSNLTRLTLFLFFSFFFLERMIKVIDDLSRKPNTETKNPILNDGGQSWNSLL